MRIVHHGGKCCGAKTIMGFVCDPDMINPALDTKDKAQCRKDVAGHEVHSDECIFRGKRPQETYKERFVAFVEYLKEVRPSGLIEVIIVKKSGSFSFQEKWDKVFKDNGFTEQEEWYNSNSGNMCTRYSLATGGRPA